MIRLVQCLCPQRHCIIALPYQPGLTAAQKDFGSMDDITLTEENAIPYVRSMVDGLIERKSIDPWCGICKSRIFHYEDGVMKAKTWEEAMAMLAANEEAQRLSRAFIEQTRN